MYRLCFAHYKKLISGLLCYCFLTSFLQAGEITIDFIGQQIIPHEYEYRNTVVGGLSSLDYNPATDSFVVICDDRSRYNPARFYQLKLDYDLSGFHNWRFTAVQFIRRPDGTTFPKPSFLIGKATVDPEAMRYAPGRESYYWASEGHVKHGVNPLVQEMTLDGAYLRDFAVPDKYLVAADGKKGARDNLVFEAMTVDGDQQSIMVSTEGPLIQDGEEANVRHGADVRFLQFDIKTGQPIHEYVYSLEPIQKETLPFGNFSVNGVVDMLALGNGRYFVLERSFSVGAGLSVRLYLADLTGATDVLSLDSLKGAAYQPATKQQLLDLGELGIAIDNIEGLAFGRSLKDGRRSLVMVSDDNFRSAQVTQLLAFAVGGLD